MEVISSSFTVSMWVDGVRGEGEMRSEEMVVGYLHEALDLISAAYYGFVLYYPFEVAHTHSFLLTHPCVLILRI